jgi:hypothetical protein
LEEQRVARQSVVEGQAMIVLYDYQLTPTKQSVESAPDLVDSMKSSMLEENSTPMYAQAPLYLREAMLFPYTYGMDFVRELLVKRGKQAAFAGIFASPPSDSRQIMEPATYLDAEPQPIVKIAPLDHILGPEWRREDVSGIGEIDLRVLLRQWAGQEVAAKLTPAWRGGYYMALSDKKAAKNAPIALALVLNFASPDAANQFAAVYETSLVPRYKSVRSLQTPHQWTTEEGFVCLYVDGATVVALESFTPDDAAKLHATLIPAAGALAQP